MKNKLLQKTIKKLVDASFKDGKIMESQVIRAVKLLKSLPRIDSIWALGEFLKELKRIERQYTMVVETSIPLPPATVKKMRKIVEKKNRITKVVVNVNPEILGGFKLKIGDEIWDESVLGKINQVKEVISGRSYSSN